MSTTELLRREWIAFRRPGRLIALAAAALTVIALGLLSTFGNRSSCDGPCPAAPVAGDGSIVSDRFWFLHRDLGREGSITVRMTSMTGTITYPPPNHDQIVPGLVPWAKAGIIVKDGVRQGSQYAALNTAALCAGSRPRITAPVEPRHPRPPVRAAVLTRADNTRPDRATRSAQRLAEPRDVRHDPEGVRVCRRRTAPCSL